MSHTTPALKIIKLPYMGIPKETKAAQTKRIESKEINMSALHDYELAQVEAQANDLADPYVVLTRKVTHMAQLLNCPEAQAERLLFDRLGK